MHALFFDEADAVVVIFNDSMKKEGWKKLITKHWRVIRIGAEYNKARGAKILSLIRLLLEYLHKPIRRVFWYAINPASWSKHKSQTIRSLGIVRLQLGQVGILITAQRYSDNPIVVRRYYRYRITNIAFRAVRGHLYHALLYRHDGHQVSLLSFL